MQRFLTPFLLLLTLFVGVAVVGNAWANGVKVQTTGTATKSDNNNPGSVGSSDAGATVDFTNADAHVYSGNYSFAGGGKYTTGGPGPLPSNCDGTWTILFSIHDAKAIYKVYFKCTSHSPCPSGHGSGTYGSLMESGERDPSASTWN